MSYRPTSAETYHRIEREGLLSKRRMQVYSIIYNHGPLNCRQIILHASHGNVTNTGAISGRLSELEDRGVIHAAYEAECPITGNNTIFWETTDSLPHEPEKRITNKEKIRRLKEAYRFLIKHTDDPSIRLVAYDILKTGELPG